ncbi:hypothetical protein DYGSA30_32800 [Dyella sp. GSA-30]|nr:hypothetical protein DYGSA30_32800 [Dyella sp. GSA-30]
MQARRQLAVLELQQHLGNAGNTGRALAMADIRLGRTNRAKLLVLRPASKRLGQSGDLDRIAQAGAGAMRFDVADRARIHATLTQRTLDHLGLCIGVWDRVTVGLAAMIDRGGLDHPVNMVAIVYRLRQRLEQDRTHAFAGHIAFATFAETLAAPLTRNELALGQHQVLVRMHRHIHATGDRYGAIATLQTPARQMDRRQRRRAHGVQRQAGAIEIAEVRNAIRYGCSTIEHGKVVPPGLLLRSVKLVFLVHHAHKHADAAVFGHVFTGVAGILQRGMHAFQEQPFLRIHQLRFARRDIEEQWIEQIDAVDKTTPLAVRLAGLAAVRVVVEPMIPTLDGNLGNAVPALAQVGPELFEIGSLRITPRHTDDGDFADVPARNGCPIVELSPRCRKTRSPHAKARAALSSCARSIRFAQWLRIRRIAQCFAQHLAQARAMVVHEMTGQRRNGLIFEQQRLGKRSEYLFQGSGQVHHENGVDAVGLHLGTCIDTVHRALERASQ